MKKLVQTLLVISVLSVLSFYSCKKSDIISVDNPAANTPVVVNTSNAFSFTVDANSFNYSETHNLQFSADTLSVAITVSGYVSGTGNIEIEDSKGASIYQKDLTNSTIFVDVFKLVTMPKTLIFNLSHFTGKAVISIAGK